MKHNLLLLTLACLLSWPTNAWTRESCIYSRHQYKNGFALHQINEDSQEICAKQLEVCSFDKRHGDVLTSVLKIPDAIDGFEVTHIAPFAFAYNQSIYSVEIGSNICQIGRGAFLGCSNIVSVAMHGNVSPEMSIGADAFRHCTKLTSLTLPTGLRAIYDCAFEECSSIKDVYIPDRCASIAEDSFSHCRTLRTAHLGNIDRHGENRMRFAFFDCPALEKITTNPSNPTYVICDGALYYRDLKAIVRCPSGHRGVSFSIKEGVEVVCPFAFEGCRFSSIVLPDSIAGIGRGAFSGCTNLVSIILPSRVKVIDDYAFWGCSNLVSVVVKGTDDPLFGEKVFPKEARIHRAGRGIFKQGE